MAICGPIEPVCSFFYSPATGTVNSWNIMLVIGVIFVGIWLIRAYAYHRDLTRNRLGDYWLNMPHLSEKIKATVFALETEKDKDRLIDAMISLHSKNPDDLKQLQELVTNNHVHAYIVRYSDTEGSSRGSGKALLLTDGALEDNAYYKEMPAERNFIRGMPTRVRMVHDSRRAGFFDDGAYEWNGEVVDGIYFPLDPIDTPEGYAPKDLERTAARALLGIIAKQDQILEQGQAIREAEIAREAAEEKMREAQRLLVAKSGEANLLGNTLAKDLYDKSQTTQVITSMNPLIAAGIVLGIVLGFYIVMPPPPGAPMNEMMKPIIFGGGLGFVIVFAMNHFVKPRASVARVPLGAEQR